MKKIALFIASTIMVLVVASLIVYHFVDINDYKANIVSLVKDKTGRNIKINGDIRLRILPDIALDISDVSMSYGNNESENAISIERIITHLRFTHLLQKEIAVSSLKLVNPVIKLDIYKDGTNNFDLDTIKNIPVEEVKKEKPQVVFEKNYNYIREFINDSIVDKFHLTSLVIEEGRIKIADERNGIGVHVDNINVQTAFIAGNNPLKISGQVKMDVGIDTPFSIEGQYQLAKDFYELAPLTVKLGNIEVHGEAGVDFRSNLPDTKVAFYFENMNLNPYSGLIDLLTSVKNNSQNDGKKADKLARSSAWAVEPIDFGILRSFNGHFSFKSNNILYKDTTIGSVTMNSYLRNGKFTLSVKEAELFGGNMNGELVVDATGNITKVRHKVNFEEVDLTKLPANFGIISNLGGRINGGVMLSSRGTSNKEFVNNVDGSVSLRIDDGFARGIDLVGMAKNVAAAFNVGKDFEQKTTFKELAGDFDINDGIIKTDNVTFVSDLLDFNGQGSASLPEQTINFRMMPKIKRPKDETDLLGGMRAPILISGNLLQPSFRLEVQTLVEDLIKNPKGTENLIKQIKRDFDDIKDNMKDDLKKDNNGVVKDIKNILNGF